MKERSSVPAPCKTAYDFYLQYMKSEIVKVLPHLSEEQRNVALANKWETLSWEQRKVFNAEADRDRQRYLQEVSQLEK